MNKLAKAVLTLTSFTVLDRFLGFLFKIYLSREMGATDLGIYQVALSFFFVLMTLTTSGLPLVSGKMTAAYDAKGEVKKSHALISAGLLVNILISALLIGLVFAFQAPLTRVTSAESMTVLFILLPGLLFCAVAAAVRGHFWGKEKYTALSVIELLEQIVRISMCVVLFLCGMGKTFAAALSLTVAVTFSGVLTVIYYKIKGGKFPSPKGQLRPLIETSAPISALRASSSLVNSLLAIAVPFLFAASGMSGDDALGMFGATIGMAMPLLYLPITVIGSLSYALIPTLSKADAEGNAREVRRQVETATKFSVVISALFIPLFFGVGKAAGVLLFDNEVAGDFLQMGGVLLIPIALESITSSMMNSLGMEKQGFVNYLIGTAAMFGVAFAFYGHFSPAVLCLSWGVSLTLSTVLDIICIRKKTGMSLGFIKTILQCVALALPCAFLAKWSFSILAFMPQILAAIVAAALGCGFLFLLYGAFDLLGFHIAKGRRKKTKDKTLKRLHIKA